jgi:hypothetical protein
MVLSHMQKLDVGYSNQENLKNYYIIIIIKACLLGLIFTFSSLIISSVTSFMQRDKDSFNYIMLYANVDSKLRSLIQLINNESYSIMMFGLYNYYLKFYPPDSDVLAGAKFLSIKITTKLRMVLNMHDIVPFIQKRIDTAITSLLKSFKSSKLMMSEKLLTPDMVSKILMVSSNITGPLESSNTNLMWLKSVHYENFINRYLVMNLRILPFLQALRPYTDGKEPPFSINNPSLLTWFITMVWGMIDQVAIGSSGILKEILASIQAAAIFMTKTSVDELKDYVLYMSFGFFAIVGLYTGYILTAFWLVKRRLLSYLTIFENLRSEEISLHIAVYQVHQKTFSTNKFKEDLMISDYMECGRSSMKGILMVQSNKNAEQRTNVSH